MQCQGMPKSPRELIKAVIAWSILTHKTEREDVALFMAKKTQVGLTGFDIRYALPLYSIFFLERT